MKDLMQYMFLAWILWTCRGTLAGYATRFFVLVARSAATASQLTARHVVEDAGEES